MTISLVGNKARFSITISVLSVVAREKESDGRGEEGWKKGGGMERDGGGEIACF